jgi:DNA polymerase III subunit chi
MTERVDFYVLKSSTAKQRWTFVCRLTEKAYLRDLKVVVLSPSVADAEALDDLLWTFNERSFVPHDLLRAAPAARASDGARPVATGSAAATAATSPAVPVTAPAAAFATPVRLTPNLDAIEAADLLVNLTEHVPARLERFARIAEIVDGDAERRAKGRERFKAYRDLKLTVETHQLDDAGA